MFVFKKVTFVWQLVLVSVKNFINQLQTTKNIYLKKYIFEVVVCFEALCMFWMIYLYMLIRNKYIYLIYILLLNIYVNKLLLHLFWISIFLFQRQLFYYWIKPMFLFWTSMFVWNKFMFILNEYISNIIIFLLIAIIIIWNHYRILVNKIAFFKLLHVP